MRLTWRRVIHIWITASESLVNTSNRSDGAIGLWEWDVEKFELRFWLKFPENYGNKFLNSLTQIFVWPKNYDPLEEEKFWINTWSWRRRLFHLPPRSIWELFCLPGTLWMTQSTSNGRPRVALRISVWTGVSCFHCTMTVASELDVSNRYYEW